MRPVAPRNDPAPSRLTYRLERLMLTPAFRLALRVGLPFCLAFGAAGFYLSEESRREAILAGLQELRRQIETRPEFMVRLLAIEGASHETEEDIREIFPHDLPASSFDISLDDLREMILGLPAVADANLRIRRGGVLVVEVTEREPVAVWRSRDGLGLVDREGNMVAGIKRRAERPELPLIVGDGAERDVPGALAILSAAAPLGSRVRGLVRIGERRWDMVLDRGQRILLPEAKPVQALERVILLDEVQEMLQRDVAVVDMRLPERPTVRMRAHAVEQWWRAMEQMAGTN